LLLQELHADDELFDLIGSPAAISRTRYPQVIAFAIAFRHSWRRDDLFSIARALGLRLNERRLVRLAEADLTNARRPAKGEINRRASRVGHLQRPSRPEPR
jgi:hypothetical protein